MAYTKDIRIQIAKSENSKIILHGSPATQGEGSVIEKLSSLSCRTLLIIPCVKNIRTKETIRPNIVRYGKSFLKAKPKFMVLSEGSTKLHLKISL